MKRNKKAPEKKSKDKKVTVQKSVTLSVNNESLIRDIIKVRHLHHLTHFASRARMHTALMKPLHPNRRTWMHLGRQVARVLVGGAASSSTSRCTTSCFNTGSSRNKSVRRSPLSPRYESFLAAGGHAWTAADLGQRPRLARQT
jgi:hypothetical protein